MSNIDPVRHFNALNPGFKVDEVKHDATNVEVQLTKDGKVYKIESKDVRIINYLQGGDKAAADLWLKEVHGLLKAIHEDPSAKVTEVSWDPQSTTLSVKTKEGRWAKYQFDKSTPPEYAYSDDAHYQQKKSPLETKKTDLETQLTTLKGQKKGGIHFLHDRHIDSQCETLSQEVNMIEKELDQLDFSHTTAAVTKIALQELAVVPPTVALESKNLAYHLIDSPIDDLKNLDVSNLKPDHFTKVFFGDIRISFDSIKAVKWGPFFAANNDLSFFQIRDFISSGSLCVDQDECTNRLHYLLYIAAKNGCDLSTIPWSQLSEKELLMVLPQILKDIPGQAVKQILDGVPPNTRKLLLNKLSATAILTGANSNTTDVEAKTLLQDAANAPLTDAQRTFNTDYDRCRFRIEERWKKTVQHLERTNPDPNVLNAARAEVEAKGTTDAEKAAILMNTTQTVGNGLFGFTVGLFSGENNIGDYPITLFNASDLTEQRIVRGNPTQIHVTYTANCEMQIDGVSISDTPLFKFQGKYTLTWNESMNAFDISDYEHNLSRVPIPIGFF